MTKNYFKDQMMLGVNIYDDLNIERLANYHGSMILEVLEERYMRQKSTHITTNYKEGYENDVEAALANLGERYGSRFYDRIFEMFNIVVFKGKSFRR